jgi:anaerobic selenocysteine-containing dehydrogenase
MPPARGLARAAGAARADRGRAGARRFRPGSRALEAAPHGIDLGPLRPNLLGRLETESGSIECAPTQLLGELERLAAACREAPPADALLLVGRREVRSNNSWMHNAPRLIKGKPRHQLFAHPDDLAARGITTDARVRVRSAAGAIETEVLASDAVMPGVVCLPHGYGHALDGVRLRHARVLPARATTT